MLLYTVIMIVYTEIVVVFLTLLAVSNVNVIIQHRSTVYTCSRSILIPVYTIIINANIDFFSISNSPSFLREYNFMFDANVNPISLKLAISCLFPVSYLWKKYSYVLKLISII